MEDTRYSTYRDGKFIDVPPIDELCLALKDKFVRQEEINNMLRTENRKLKEGIWEKEYVKETMEAYNRMKADYYRGFPISEDEWEKLKEWQKQYINSDTNIGAIGGMFTYKFTPTSIGTSGVCIAPNGDEFEFQTIG